MSSTKITKQKSVRKRNITKGVLAPSNVMAKKHNEYIIDNTKVPSVTTVLNAIPKPQLDQWKRAVGYDEADKIVMRAADFGSEVHELIEIALSTGQVKKSDDEDINLAVRNMVAWSNKNVEKWLGFEKGVYNNKEMYAGTADGFAILKTGKLVLVDFKTSKSVRDEYFLQLAAYYNCTSVEDKPCNLKKLQGAIILHLNRKTYDWDVYQVENIPLHFDVFLSVLKVYNWVYNKNALLQEKPRKRTKRVTT